MGDVVDFVEELVIDAVVVVAVDAVGELVELVVVAVGVRVVFVEVLVVAVVVVASQTVPLPT